MKSIWFYLICFYPKKILENFEENRLLSEKLFSLVVQFLVSPPMENLGVVSVCAVAFSHFPEILYEVRVQKVRKNVPRAFWIIFTILAKNWPKFVFLAENGGCCFLRTAHYIFLFFCLKHRLCSRKKDVFTLFLEMSKIALFDQIWTKFGLLAWCTGVWFFCRSLKKMLH